jgi:hypothetical protein
MSTDSLAAVFFTPGPLFPAGWLSWASIQCTFLLVARAFSASVAVLVTVALHHAVALVAGVGEQSVASFSQAAFQFWPGQLRSVVNDLPALTDSQAIHPVKHQQEDNQLLQAEFRI